MAPESRDEVRQRIESLYDQAENETGNYNATRAMAAVTRSRGVPLAKRSGRRPDPALDEMTRQWFEGARAKFGPTVPAILPGDRLPDRSTAPARSLDRRGGGGGGGERDALETGLPDRRPLSLEQAPGRRAVAELTAGGPALDSPSGPQTELTGARAALPGPRRPELPGTATNPAGLGNGAEWPGGPSTPESRTPGTPAATALPGLGTQGATTSTAPDPWGTAALMTPGARESVTSTVPGTQGAAATTTPGALGATVLSTPDTQGWATLMTPGTQGGAALMTPGAQGGASLMAPGALEATALTTTGALDATALMTTDAQEVAAASGSLGTAALMTPGALDATALTTTGALDATALMTPGPQGTPLGLGPVETAGLPGAAQPAVQGTPVPEPTSPPGAAVPGRPSPATSKASNQRKLAAASDILSRHIAQLLASATAVRPAPVTAAASMPTPAQPGAAQVAHVPQAGAAQAGQATGQWQQPQWAAAPVGSAAEPQAPAGTIWPDAATSAIATGSFPSPALTAPATDTGPFPQPALLTPLTGSGAFPSAAANTAPVPYLTPPDPGTSTAAVASPALPTPLGDTGSLPYPGGTSLTGTGSFQPMSTAAAAGTGAGVAQTASPPGLPPVPESSRAGRAAKAIAFARAQIGKPCVWGAMGPGSYDCSSLTQAAWKAAGVTVPRAAHEQALAGAPVTLAGVEPGDLVLFFDDDRHVGLYVGAGMMVHAPGPGSTIREESIYGAGESAIHRIVRPA
ncbi:NlpC/P60 family protein [Streptomyces sp. FXJ1.172]|uniref:NlpC/P60 family protein n=1 Tax=Streptomyces sp. FXJ1.172 TaxID=710705 RepID=UPI000ABCD65A